MNADQFFFLVFCTITKREVFGLMTFYYTDALLYSLMFGLTLMISKLTVNNCMLYRDSILALIGLCLHILYVLTLNQMILLGNLGLYVLYVVADWKNETFTHIGMKLCGKIKDDDSFEGEFPMSMLRIAPNIKDEYKRIPIILRKHAKRYNRDIKNHRVLLTLLIDKQRKMPGQWIDDETMKRKIEVKMRLVTAVYQIIFFLKECIEGGKRQREDEYNKTLTNIMNFIPEADNVNFPKSMAKGNIDVNDNKIEELSEEQNEEMDKVSEIPHKRSGTCKV